MPRTTRLAVAVGLVLLARVATDAAPATAAAPAPAVEVKAALDKALVELKAADAGGDDDPFLAMLLLGERYAAAGDAAGVRAVVDYCEADPSAFWQGRGGWEVQRIAALPRAALAVGDRAIPFGPIVVVSGVSVSDA